MVESNYNVECPKYRLECDIESCPRYLTRCVIDIDEVSGELVASGFCHERGIKFFPSIPNNKISIKTISEQHAEQRTKGFCEFSGTEVNSKIDIDPGVSVTVNFHKHSFTAGKSWEIFNRFFRSIKAGDDHSDKHYPVQFTTSDYNQLKDDALALFDKYCERQPAIERKGNKQFEPYARFKLELL